MVQNPTVKLILFDIGGGLIDYERAFRNASIEQNIPYELIGNTFDKYDKEITSGKIAPQELYLKCLKDNNINADPNYDFTDSWIRDYSSFKPTFDLINKLKSGYQIGLLSNIYKNMIPVLKKRKLIPDIAYDFLFISCDTGLQKPDLEAYEQVLETTKLQPQQILFVDDRDDNLAIAAYLKWNIFKFSKTNPASSVKTLIKMLLK
ncbi:HAD-IA family hydrolase [Candidatus Collierbacteria bacterium]|nr:HAD-IA family hydrolase [Candidatus Collierbacteria bacterium]